MPDAKQISIWESQVEAYKKAYESLYPGKKPPEKLIACFCNMNKIPWPLPDPEKDLEFDFLL